MRVFVKVALVAMCLGLLACGKSKKDDSGSANPDEASKRSRVPIKVTAQPPDGVAAALWADIGWFPADIKVITEMTRKDRMLPFVDFIKRMGRTSGWPKCAFEHLNKVDRYYMAAQSMRARSTMVFFANVERTLVDDCARKVAAKPSLKGTAHSRGPITELRALGNKAFLGWVDLDGVRVTVFDSDEKRVDAFLGAVKRIGAKHPLTRPLTSANRKADQWVVGAADLGSQYFGVPSSSFSLDMKFKGEINKGKAVPLDVSGWIDFDVDTKAREALGRMEKALAAIGDKLPLEVLQNIKRRVEGSRLRIDIKLDTAALVKVMGWLAEAGKTMRALGK